MATYHDLPKLIQHIKEAAITAELRRLEWHGDAASGYASSGYDTRLPPVSRDAGELVIEYRASATGDTGGGPLPPGAELIGEEQAGGTGDVVYRYRVRPGQDIYAPWFDRIEEAFEGWAEIADPHTTFTAPLTALYDAITLLTYKPTEGGKDEPPFTAQAELNSAIDEVDVMTDNGVGRTVETFRRYYGAARLETVIANQRNAMLALATAMLAEQHAMKKLRDDVVTIAERAKAGFENGSGGSVSLTVVKAIGELASAALPGLGKITSAIQKGVQITGAVKSLLPAEPPSQGPVPLDGDTPDAVYSNLVKALNTLSLDLYDTEKAIHSGPIDGMLDAIYQYRDDYHIDHEIGLAEEVEALPANSIDVNPGTMRKIGTYWLPLVADQLGRSATKMNAGGEAAPWSRPNQIGGYGGSWGPYESWRELHDVIDTLTTSSGAELIAGGNKLVAAAGGIQVADEDSYHVSAEAKKQLDEAGGTYGWDPSGETPEDAEPPDQQNPSER